MKKNILTLIGLVTLAGVIHAVPTNSVTSVAGGITARINSIGQQARLEQYAPDACALAVLQLEALLDTANNQTETDSINARLGVLLARGGNGGAALATNALITDKSVRGIAKQEIIYVTLGADAVVTNLVRLVANTNIPTANRLNAIGIAANLIGSAAVENETLRRLGYQALLDWPVTTVNVKAASQCLLLAQFAYDHGQISAEEFRDMLNAALLHTQADLRTAKFIGQLRAAIDSLKVINSTSVTPAPSAEIPRPPTDPLAVAVNAVADRADDVADRAAAAQFLAGHKAPYDGSAFGRLLANNPTPGAVQAWLVESRQVK